MEEAVGSGEGSGIESRDKMTVKRILVVDLPNSGQAAVKYVKYLKNTKRNSADYYPASVLNSVLGRRLFFAFKSGNSN